MKQENARQLFCFLSVTIVEALSKVDVVNDKHVDIHIDKNVLGNAKKAGARHYRLRKLREQIKIV